MRARRWAGLGMAIALTATLAACANGDSAPASSDEPDAQAEASESFPVTIEHVYGETVIETQPERIATVAWANHEVPLALGVVPVGMAKATWGDDDNDGVLPWVEDKLEELGAETPTLWDETDGIDFEAVADSAPDVILASYSGLTRDEYDTLSKIAPVVAYPENAWATSYQDMIRMNAKAIGLAAEGDALIEDLQAQVETAYAKYPALHDAAPVFAYFDANDLSQIGYYPTRDTRPGFLHDLGVPVPTVMKELSAETTEFYDTVSSEEAGRFDDVGLFVTYGDDDTIIDQLQADPLLSKIPAIAAGKVAVLKNSTPLAASANPSPLSTPWGVDDYFAVLAAPLEQ